MDTADRPLHALDPSAVDAYIDRAIDQLFVPKFAPAAAQPPPSDGSPAGVEVAEDPETCAKTPEAPLDALQEAVLSLEWEVCERNVLVFEQEALAVGERYSADRHVGAVVQMATKVSKYLLAVGEGASEAGIGFPTAALRALENLLRQPAPSAAERRSEVETLLEKYRMLQAEARRRQGKTSPRPEATAEPPLPPPAPSAHQAAGLLQESSRSTEVAVDATERIEGTPAEELEPEDATEFEELDPEPLDPEPEEELEPEPDLRPGTILPAPAWATETGFPPPGREPGPELPEEGRAPAHWSREDDRSEPASAFAATEFPSAGEPVESARETSRHLSAFLGELRERMRDRLGHARRAAANGSPRWLDELAELGDVMETGFNSALEMARELGPASAEEEGTPVGTRFPAADAAAFRGDLDGIRSAIEALTVTVQAIDARIGGRTGSGPFGALQSTPQTASVSGGPASAPA